MREGLEDFDLLGAHQRLEEAIGLEPSGRVWL